jgi:hypothetical protein
MCDEAEFLRVGATSFALKQSHLDLFHHRIRMMPYRVSEVKDSGIHQILIRS